MIPFILSLLTLALGNGTPPMPEPTHEECMLMHLRVLIGKGAADEVMAERVWSHEDGTFDLASRDENMVVTLAEDLLPIEVMERVVADPMPLGLSVLAQAHGEASVPAFVEMRKLLPEGHFFKSRVKGVPGIKEKIYRKIRGGESLSLLSRLYDIVGARIVTPDAQSVTELDGILGRSGRYVLVKREEVSKPRYLAIHYDLMDGEFGLPFELQVRSKYMDALSRWSHRILYKKNVVPEYQARLEAYGEELGDWLFQADFGRFGGRLLLPDPADFGVRVEDSFNSSYVEPNKPHPTSADELSRLKRI